MIEPFEIAFARRVRTGKPGVIAFQVDPDRSHDLAAFLQKQVNKGRDFYRLKIYPVGVPRTVGPGSQSAHFNGLARAIAQHTGDDVEDVRTDLKRRAFKRGYPVAKDDKGHPVLHADGQLTPESEANADAEQMNHLIEEAIDVCRFLGIRTRKDGEDEHS